jgi:hypothetical protein
VEVGFQISAEKRDATSRPGWAWSLGDTGAYALIQSTKPQSLAQGLNDSPAGLAAWILEKFHGWSDCGSNVESRFSKDELLPHVMIYWARCSWGRSPAHGGCDQ